MATSRLLLLSVAAFVCVNVVMASSAEDYWRKKLPNTPIPLELQKELQSDSEDKNTFWDMGSDGEDAFIDAREKYGKRYAHAFYAKGYAFNKHIPNSTVFFAYNDLHAGQKMTLHITKSSNKARFLPRKVADSLPFSTDKLSKIFKLFSIKPESGKGKLIKQTVEDCESPGVKGEDRYCPTSLESLVDFGVKHVGNKAQVLYNEVAKPTKMQEYTVMDVKFMGKNHVVCHKQKYPYAIYYCHNLSNTKVYTAPLVGANGIKARAVALCHSDTSAWNPEHLAFLMLNMKPGEGPICHFIRSDTFVLLAV